MAAVLTLGSLLLPAVIGTRSEVRECAFSDHLQQHRVGSQRSANLQRGEIRDNGTIRCGRGLACFGLWEQRPGGEVLLLKQGCWMSQPDCLSDQCLVTAPPAHIHKGSYRFCCCSHDLCNAQFREALSTAPPPVHKLPDAGGLPGNSSALVAVGTVAVAILAVMLLFCGYTLLTGKKKLSSSSLNEEENGAAQCGDMDDLKLWELIGRGRFASVYRGSLSNHTVAVKVFSSAHRQKYASQRAIYHLPLLQQQQDLAHFLSAHERSDGEGCVQHLIVMDYYPHGSLSHFLSRSSMDWASCCRMVLGVTRGLSFLHSEVHVGDQSKPAVAHRDVNSSNVLVRSDLSCVLSGFSLAMSLSRDPGGGHRDPGSVAISEAGALRYRAPELLSGTLDLHEYGTALKQVDVYALGLLFWESFRRCHDLFLARAAPPFELAFEAELGQEPSLEDMHELVAREKYRPLFPSEWKHNSPVLRLLKETMEDCWDHDAEARLSAQCAEERLSQLSLLNVPTALTPSNQSNGCWPPTGPTSSIPDHVSEIQTFQVTSTGRPHEEQRMQQQVIPQRPSSLQFQSTAAFRERQGPPQLPAPSRQKYGVLHSRERQVETGVAKMNAVAVLAHAPVTVNMATNRSAVLMADGSSAGAPTLVTNSLIVRGLTNQAGPQLEDDDRSLEKVSSLEQEPGPNFLWSPDEDQPLLKNEVPPAGAILSVQHTNANNNNNYCSSHRARWTSQRTGHSEGTCPAVPERAQLFIPAPTEAQSSHVMHLSEDIPQNHPESDVTIEILKRVPCIQSDELKVSCRNGEQISLCERQETVVISLDNPKDTAKKWNMDIVNTQTSEDPQTFMVRNALELSHSSTPLPVSQTSSEHPAGVCLSPASLVHAPSSAPLSQTSTDLVQSTTSSQREKRPARPCSLDLSSPSPTTDEAPLTDSGLSASGEKIRRRVKTPYTVKKWRPASWVPPADHYPGLILQASPNCPKIAQSKSSMAVFLLGDRATASSTPDGLTSF